MTRACTFAVAAAVAGCSLAYGMPALGDPGQPGSPPTVYVPVTVTVQVDRTIEHHGVQWWRERAVANRRRLNHANLRLERARLRIRRETLASRRRWEPTLRSAVALASAVTGVPASELLRVAWCESTDNPFASNGTHFGYWQLSWSPFGLSPYDPYAAALSTAMTVKHDHGWGQWAASRPCHGLS